MVERNPRKRMSFYFDTFKWHIESNLIIISVALFKFVECKTQCKSRYDTTQFHRVDAFDRLQVAFAGGITQAGRVILRISSLKALNQILQNARSHEDYKLVI